MAEQQHGQHAAEVEERWGGTEAYRQSNAKTKGYSDADWVEIEAELDAIEADFARALESGVAPDDDQALALAERARSHIDRRYYSCSHDMHAALADMYTADERFKAHYEDRREGLAEYVSAAIKANAARRST
jgi:hypothetical protein